MFDRVEDDLHHLKVIDRKTLLSLVPISRAQAFRLEAAGLFPRALQISPNKVGYRLSEVEAWLRNRPLAVRNRTAAGSSNSNRPK